MLEVIQQSVHGDRRGDGGRAAEHRLVGQHQGAARFLLRAVRPRRRPDRQRAAHPGPSRLDGRFDPHHHRGARRRRATGAACRPGDVYVLNAPYRGGTHLPDITVIMPVFADDGDAAPAWFVAARGHHADIGGIAPGSMPPDSRTIHEEGVLIDNVLLVDEGRFREAEMRALLASGDWPARNPDRNIADLKAQVAACARGAGELRRVAGEYGRDVDRRLYGPCHGQCRGGGAAADRPAERRRLHATRWTMAPRSAVAITVDREARIARSSISPAPARSSRTISTRLIRSAARRRSTSSAPWSTTRSR